MNQASPPVSIGMPIYNGQQFVAQAVDSILAQSYGDFELIISDNASTDDTPEICRQLAATDRRIRYSRVEQNCGAAANFCRVFQLARGTYFRWAAHDDLISPGYLQRCLEVLAEDAAVVVAYSQAAVIDGQGRILADFRSGPPDVDRDNVAWLESPSAATRLCGVLVHTLRCYEMFGLVRSAAMRRTRLHRPYPGAEKIFLTELALQGRFQQIRETLFFSRRHADRFSTLPSAHSQAQWMSAVRSRRWVVPRHLRTSWGALGAVARLPLPWSERVRCLASLSRYLAQWHKLGPVLAEACDGLGWRRGASHRQPTVAANHGTSQAADQADQIDRNASAGHDSDATHLRLPGISVPGSADLALAPESTRPAGSVVISHSTSPAPCCGKSTLVID